MGTGGLVVGLVTENREEGSTRSDPREMGDADGEIMNTVESRQWLFPDLRGGGWPELLLAGEDGEGWR